jgi:Protein of unknown function (DUF3224)
MAEQRVLAVVGASGGQRAAALARALGQPRMSAVLRVVAVLGLSLAPLTGARTSPAPAPSPSASAPVRGKASGDFEVKLTPRPFDDAGGAESASLGRMSIRKTLRGELSGTSEGVMLSAMGEVKGSAGYVALERVKATLLGRGGTFVLQHSGTLTRGAPQLSITVVPDSGTGQLVGLAGHMTIDVADDGRHSYVFEYTLPATP